MVRIFREFKVSSDMSMGDAPMKAAVQLEQLGYVRDFLNEIFDSARELHKKSGSIYRKVKIKI